ncbi:MAG: tetratricopeptide repeat protein [Verrucomicrobiota bacterium]|jgi:tetratricopeptide (TPR) repeat protein
MPTDPNTSSPESPDPLPPSSEPAKDVDRSESIPDHPPSKPLQIFLLVALLISGAAYVVDQLTQFSTEDAMARRPSNLRRRVANQSQFLTNTELGRQAEAKKRFEDAVIDYRRALLGQDTAEGRLNLGGALLNQGNPDMAFEQFKEALRLNRGLEAVYIAWGQALKRQGKLDEAEQVYQDALRFNSNFAQVHFNFATVLEQQQQTAQVARREAELANQPQAAAKASAEAQLLGSDAVKHYATAKRLGLNTPEFWSRYGTLLNNQRKYTEAETCLETAVAQQPGLGAAQFQLAVALDRQGHYAEAIRHYEATLISIPDDVATLNALALLYATATNQQARSSKMAILLATRACDATTSQNARYLDTLARAYAADGDFLQARDWEDKAVRRATQLADHELLRELQPRFNLFLQHRTE